MRNLNHHSLMKLQEVFESDNSLYIVFQLLEGGQLYDKIKVIFYDNSAKILIQALLDSEDDERFTRRTQGNAFQRYYAQRFETLEYIAQIKNRC